MATTTSKTKNKLNFLENHFKLEDYNDYISGKIRYAELCDKFECTDYIMSTFLKKNNLPKRKKLRENNINETIFDTITTPESAYIFGLYIADGCITKDNKFIISLNENDLEILTKVRDIISPITKLLYRPKYVNQKTGITSNPMYLMGFKCNHIANTLNKYGCGYNKTYIEKSIKNIIPREFMWDFIRGYFDGDGCVSKSVVNRTNTLSDGTEKKYTHTNVIFKITSKTNMILEEIKDFMYSEGISISVYPDRESFTLGNHSLKDLKSIYKKLYTSSDLYMKRKKLKFEEIIGNTEITTETKESVAS